MKIFYKTQVNESEPKVKSNLHYILIQNYNVKNIMNKTWKRKIEYRVNKFEIWNQCHINK